MLVLAAVPADQCHKLRRAAAPRFPVVHARDWDDALAIIRTRPVELAAVDPQLEGSPSAREIERLRILFPSLPLILYTALTPPPRRCCSRSATLASTPSCSPASTITPRG